MREPFQSPISPLLVGFVVFIIILTVVVWFWAVRRPVTSEVANPGTVTVEPRPLVYAAIGASDVVGVGATDPSAESWVNALHSMMPEGTRFVRLGRGGITLREANIVEVPEAVAAQPDIVTLWNCVNDALRGVPLADYIKELRTALDMLTKGTDATVFVLNVPDISSMMAGNLDSRQEALIKGGIQQWNKAIAETAAEYGGRVRVVDLFVVSDEIAEHPEYISPDNFHPSTTGYRRLAELVWQGIEREQLLER
ncbi:MAG: GDSL-type esterase/lipase family protein [Chloroflexia bacterium]